MTIGKNSSKSSVRSSIRTPKFLDKSSGFYGRLDEPETAGERDGDGGKEVTERGNGTGDGSKEGGVMNGPSSPSVGVFDFNEGMMEDDGETLLRRKPSRRSSRWRRSSRRKQEEEAKTEEDVPQDERPSPGTESQIDAPVLEGPGMEVEVERLKKMVEGDGGRATEPVLVHFAAREDAEDRVLIRDKKRVREEEEGEEERRMKREQEEGMKVVKRNSLKNYRKALDRAFRRGWETFITNIYSVTLMPVAESPSSSSSPSSQEEHQHNVALAESR